MLIFQINYFAILLAAVASMASGFLWYSPLLFSEPYIRLTGMKKGDMDQSSKGMSKTYGMSTIASLITAYVLAYFFEALNVTSVAQALQTSIWLWAGFIAPIMFTSVLYEKKPLALYAINTGYQLASLLAMSAVLVLLSKGLT